MTMTPYWLTAPFRVLGTLFTTLLRVAAALLGLAFMLGMLLLGATAGGLLILWALLRGRRPGWRLASVPPGAGWHHFRTSPLATPRRTPVGEVVDIEAREMPVHAAPTPGPG